MKTIAVNRFVEDVVDKAMYEASADLRVYTWSRYGAQGDEAVRLEYLVRTSAKVMEMSNPELRWVAQQWRDRVESLKSLLSYDLCTITFALHEMQAHYKAIYHSLDGNTVDVDEDF